MGLLDLVKETLSSPVDVFLLGVIGFIFYKIFKRSFGKAETLPPPEPQLPPLPKQDMDLDTLKTFDGTNEEGRICMAVDGDIFDVSRAKRLYGKEGPYGLFAGRDASRGLATFEINTNAVKEVYDDISDLGAYERESLNEWKTQFSEKYDVVGRLLKPGEVATDYSQDQGDKKDD